MQPDPTPTSAEPTRRRLIGCSAERTVLAILGEDGAPVRILKRFETGSPSDAERERAAAELARGPGIPACLGTGTDPANGRPTLTFVWSPGTDLAELVRRDGPLTLSRTVAIARGIASILSRLRASPHRLVHRDVKPSNVLVHEHAGRSDVHLIDLEHLEPATSAHPAASFTGGSHGFAPPEAYRGAPPDPSFDVFGFGCCLRFMLTGELPRGSTASSFRGNSMRWAPDAVRDLVADSMAAVAEQRPPWTEIFERLDAIAARIEDTASLDTARRAMASAEFDLAAAALDDASPQLRADRAARLRRDLDRRRRLWSRTESLEFGDTNDFADLARGARAVTSVLARFPGSSRWRRRRVEILELVAARLPEVPAIAKRHERRGQFAQARRLLAACRTAVESCASLGALPLGEHDPDQVAPILRSPLRVLALTEHSLASAEDRHSDLIGRVEAAEAALDSRAAELAIESAVHTYGGASEITAGLKERLHELEFVVGRIAGGARAIEDATDAIDGPELELDRTRAFIDRCAAFTGEPSMRTSCRNLLREFETLRRDSPHLREPTELAIQQLRSALETLTDEAWTKVETAQAELEAVPIPIRPLQATLNRLDRLELAGALVDLPDRTRGQLLDEIETVRLGVERARATRDRLARGAQQAMDQGHLTTAIYELERVASNFEDETSQAHGAPIRDHYARAKELKERVEAALRQNHELATRCQRAIDEEEPIEVRIELLRERERILEFLRRNVGDHRAAPYASDLDRIRFTRFSETLAQGEARYGASDPSIRGMVASQIATELAVQVPASGWSREQIGRARQAIDLWRARASEPTTVAPRRRPTRTRRWSALAGSILAAIALSWGWTAWAGSSSASLDELAGELWATLEGRADRAESLARLRAFVDAMQGASTPAQHRAAVDLVAHVGADVIDDAWFDGLREALAAYDAEIPDGGSSLIVFGRAAHSVALIRAHTEGIGLERHAEQLRDSRLAPPRAILERTQNR